MKNNKWTMIFIISLILMSISVYVIHYFVFRDAHHIGIFLVEDIAFIPLEVIIVSLFFHKLIEEKHKKQLIEKLSILVGVFFNEVGKGMLERLNNSMYSNGKVCSVFDTVSNWVDKDFKIKEKEFPNYKFKLKEKYFDINEFAELLREKRAFLMTMLQNPVLLEKDSFTFLLRYVFYLEEQLEHYDNFTEKDKLLLKKDIENLYPLLLKEWFFYLNHLKKHNKQVFDLAVRNNPFNCKNVA
jgi:hypothetical protein